MYAIQPVAPFPNHCALAVSKELWHGTFQKSPFVPPSQVLAQIQELLACCVEVVSINILSCLGWYAHLFSDRIADQALLNRCPRLCMVYASKLTPRRIEVSCFLGVFAMGRPGSTVGH